MINAAKQEIIQINSKLYELTQRKKDLEIYIQGFEESQKAAAEVEKSLNEKIKELEERLGENGYAN